jgi:iron complex transport system ATP-binding protein
MVELLAKQISVIADDGAMLVAPTDFALRGGELVALIGPNGAGKSSLVRSLAGITPYAGLVQIDGIELSSMPVLSRAGQIAWLPQSLPPAWPVTVHDAVALGRFAYGAVPGRLVGADAEAVTAALAACDITAVADRKITTLSGGELARVHLARALATEAGILLADEPAAALDLRHGIALMEVLRAQVAAERLVLVIMHDIALAVRWADRVIVMNHGKIVADGPTTDVITPALLRDIFGITATISSRDGRPVVEIIGMAAVEAG